MRRRLPATAHDHARVSLACFLRRPRQARRRAGCSTAGPPARQRCRPRTTDGAPSPGASHRPGGRHVLQSHEHPHRERQLHIGTSFLEGVSVVLLHRPRQHAASRLNTHSCRRTGHPGLCRGEGFPSPLLGEGGLRAPPRPVAACLAGSWSDHVVARSAPRSTRRRVFGRTGAMLSYTPRGASSELRVMDVDPARTPTRDRRRGSRRDAHEDARQRAGSQAPVVLTAHEAERGAVSGVRRLRYVGDWAWSRRQPWASSRATVSIGSPMVRCCGYACEVCERGAPLT